MGEQSQASSGLRGLLRRLARSLPPMRRYHDRVLAIVGERDAAVAAIAEAQAAAAAQRAVEAELRAALEPFVQAQAESRLVIFEYPYDGRPRDWRSSPGVGRLRRRLAAEAQSYAAELAGFLPLADSFAAIALDEGDKVSPADPHWLNPWFPPLDAMALYAFLVRHRPRRYVEVGSGNSTRFARRAIRDHGLPTRIVSIDPHPVTEIDDIADEVVRRPLESVDPGFFAGLGAEDLFFLDSSHRAFANSDVTVFFTEVLPVLPRGMLYGIHDIFLPDDYPAVWDWRWFNEQYMLAAYLYGGGDGDRIVLPAYYVQTTAALRGVLDPILDAPGLSRLERVGGAFWLRKA